MLASLSLFLLLVHNVGPSDCARPVENISALQGKDISLNCESLTELSSLYSVKWYKQHHCIFYEFYSTITSPEERTESKELPGMHIQTEPSIVRGSVIVVKNVSIPATGIYKCEVVSEVNGTFHTQRLYYNLTIIVPQKNPPRILSEQKRYKVGDKVQLTCVSDVSQPRPTIQWLINGQAIPAEYLLETSMDHPNESTTTSSIGFTLRHEHLSQGQYFSVECRSFLENHFAPEEMSSVILEAWHERTPLIVGLESHYTIGQRITLNCTVPALHSHIPNPMGTLYWLVNGHKVRKTNVVNYFHYGHIGLDMVLTAKHLWKSNTFTIECRSIQQWSKHILPRKLNTTQTMVIHNTTLDYDDEGVDHSDATTIQNHSPGVHELGESNDETGVINNETGVINMNSPNVEDTNNATSNTTSLITQLVSPDKLTSYSVTVLPILMLAIVLILG